MTAETSIDMLERLVAQAKRTGADAADAVLVRGESVSLSRRLGEIEHVERADGNDVGLRVLVGHRQAIVSSSDTGREALDELVERAVAMARSVPEDPWCGLAEPGQIATEFPDLDAVDAYEPTTTELTGWAARAEEAAMAVDGVTNSEGATAGHGRSTVTLVASNGFARTYHGSQSSLSVSVLAGEGTGMERDYDYTSAVYAADLMDPAVVGRSAGEKAVGRINPRRPKTARVPVVFDPRVSRGLIGHLASAINGQAVARGTTFLKDALGTQVFAPGVSIVDDPLRRRGLRSKPFDAEGLATRTKRVVEDGVLKTWILDLASARQLGLESTGNASRGTSSPPSPSVTNLYLAPGTTSAHDLVGAIDDGFYVTELIGFGINMVTGDYSRGAAGFWIEKGRITYPVSEITIAGNLKDMFLNLTPADDLVFRYGTDAPTVRVDGLTVAGA